MTSTTADLTLRTAKLAGFSCAIAAGLYTAAQVEPSPLAALFVSTAPLIAVILWLQKDARRTGVGAVQDWGFFLWFAWPALIPWYVLKTRGRAGWPLLVGLFGLIGSAYIAGFVVAWFVYGIQYAIWYFD